MSNQKPTPAHPLPLLDILKSSFLVFREYKPLAVGIHKAIREKLPEVDERQLREAMKRHTGSTRYLKGLTEGGDRFDLDANPAGEVTEEQREQAATTIRERFRKDAERRKAEQEMQRRQENLLKLAEKFNARVTR